MARSWSHPPQRSRLPAQVQLVEHGLIGSMSAVANPYDKAQAESFMKTLKVEDVVPRWLRDIRGRHRSAAAIHRGGLQRPTPSLGARVSSTYRVRSPIRPAGGLDLTNPVVHLQGFT